LNLFEIHWDKMEGSCALEHGVARLGWFRTFKPESKCQRQKNKGIELDCSKDYLPRSFCCFPISFRTSTGWPKGHSPVSLLARAVKILLKVDGCFAVLLFKNTRHVCVSDTAAHACYNPLWPTYDCKSVRTAILLIFC
jgi:hypothetical protein